MYNKDKRYKDVSDTIDKHKYRCEHCGRREVIRADMDRKICTHCGHYIYKSQEIKYKYKFMEKIKEELKK